MTKDEMIEVIIEHDITVNSGDDDWYLRSILCDGFKGYSNMTEEEIKDLYDQCHG